MSENKSRAEFEAWADGKVTSLAMRLGSYMYADTSRAWEAWLASRKAALEEAAQWRPIETAPKCRMLALVDGQVRIVAWGKASHMPWQGYCLADQGPEDFDLCEPTHWMPLPSAIDQLSKGEAND